MSTLRFPHLPPRVRDEYERLKSNNLTTRRPHTSGGSPGARGPRPDRIMKMGALIIVILFLLTLLITWSVIAPEYRSYPPNTVTVTTGTGGGTVDYLYAVDTLVYSVLEEDVGASSTLTATDEWIVTGTLDSGTFPDDTETQDGTGVVYLEADDGNGRQDNAFFLVPEGVGTYTAWTPIAPQNWQMVDDDPPHDGDVTYVFTSAHTQTDTYRIEDTDAMPVGYALDGNLFAFAWGKLTGPVGSGHGLQNRVRTYGADFDDVVELFAIQNVWQNISVEHVVNPVTGLDWTIAEINAVEVGMVSVAPVPITIRVTSVGAVAPLRQLNFALDVRHNVTAVPAGREYYTLTMRALTDPGEDITVSVYDHVAPGWDTAFTFTTSGYVTADFPLVEADHVNAGEVWLRYTDAGGDAVTPDGFDIDLLNVRAYDVEYTLEVSFNWVGLDSEGDPRLSVVGYKSDAELMTLQVLRSGAWTTLDANIFVAGVMTSWAFTLAPADVEGSALQVRFVDNDVTDNAASTIYLDLLTVRVEMVDESPAAPIDVYVDVSYDLWANEIILGVHWVQTGGPEPALETGKWITVWADDVEIGTYAMPMGGHVPPSTGYRRVPAPWSFFDGRDHNVTAVGAVNVEWPTWGGDQTYYSDPELERVSNFPRFAVLMFGLFCLLAVVAIVAVRAIHKRREEDEKGP